MGGRNATLLMSGGIDSAACASFLSSQGCKTSALFVEYGQPGVVQERVAAWAIAARLGIEIRGLSFSGAGPLDRGELAGRNAFLVFAALFATRASSGLIALGIHAGTPYYDCSEVFLDRINRAVAEHTDGAVQVVAPFIHWSKREVYDYFIKVGLPIEETYSCEAGTEPTCGSCSSCLDRRTLQC